MNEDEIKKLLGLRIKQLRKNMGITQFVLGEKIGIDQRQIAYIEGGNSFPSLKTLNKFSEVFNCSLKDLFDYEHLTAKKNVKSNIEQELNTSSDTSLQLYYELIKTINKFNL